MIEFPNERMWGDPVVMETTERRKLICLEITGRCGLNCIHCSTRSNLENFDILDYSLIKNILTQSFNLGFKELAISGGDPFLHPDLFLIISAAKKIGFNVKIYTNGNMMEKSNLSSISKRIFNQLNDVGLDKLVFSIHGTTKEVHDKITEREGSFQNLIDSIAACNEVNTVFEKEFNFVIMKPNLNCKEELIPFIQEFNIHKLHLLRIVPHGRGKENEKILNVSEQEVNEFLFYFTNESIKKYITDSASLPIEGKVNRETCRAGKGHKLVITPKGYVFPCVAMKNIYKGEAKNNIHKHSLKAIMNNSQIFKAINSQESTSNKVDWDCNECPAQQLINIE